MVRGAELRRRRGRDVDGPRSRVAATPRPRRGWSAEPSRGAAAATRFSVETGARLRYRRKNKKDLVLAEVHGDVVEAPAPKTRKRAAAAAPENTAPTRAEKVAPQKGPTRAAAPTGRSELVAEYTRLTKKALPALAKAHAWPIRFDHCFMRVRRAASERVAATPPLGDATEAPCRHGSQPPGEFLGLYGLH